MSVKLLTEHHLELLRLKGGCTGSSESTLVKIPHCWKSHVAAHMCYSLLMILSKMGFCLTFPILFLRMYIFCKQFEQQINLLYVCLIAQTTNNLKFEVIFVSFEYKSKKYNAPPVLLAPISPSVFLG